LRAWAAWTRWEWEIWRAMWEERTGRRRERRPVARWAFIAKCIGGSVVVAAQPALGAVAVVGG